MGTIILSFFLIALAALAWAELHIKQITTEIQIRTLIRKSASDARKLHRNPVRYVSAGYSPRR